MLKDNCYCIVVSVGVTGKLVIGNNVIAVMMIIDDDDAVWL